MDTMEGTKKRGKGHKLDVTEKILEIKNEYPDLKHNEIAKMTGCTRQNVTQTLQRYGIKPSNVNRYRKFRADILAGIQEQILHSISKEDLNKASLKDKTISMSILFDKERLEQGKSTTNIALAKLVEKVERNKEHDKE